jgi:hypothetical protein
VGRFLLSALLATVALTAAVASECAGAGGDPLLAAVGDISCPPESVITPEACQQGATARLVQAARPSSVALLGDIQYEQSMLPEFMGPGAFNETWGPLMPLVHAVPGNHEYSSSPTAAGYFQYFGAAAGPGGRGYYSYRLGSWHVIALNSACLEACADTNTGIVSAAEVRWLRSDLAHVRRRCILAFWHHPRFSSTVGLGEELGVAPLWRLLYRARADVVINGHAHDYERFAQLDPEGRPTPRGIREFVVGTGGRNHFHFVRKPLRSSERRDDRDFGTLLLALHRERYAWRFVTVRGSIVDGGSTVCHRAR